jgi:hypothetical protein
VFRTLRSRLGQTGRIVTLLLVATVFGYPLLAFLAVAFRDDSGGLSLFHAFASCF